MTHWPRAARFRWLGAAVLSLMGCAARADGMVGGLIVQLRDAPTHAELVHERTTGQGREGPKGAHEAERARRVLTAVPRGQVRDRRAVLASAQHWRFAAPQPYAEAEALARRVAQQPEVAWALPDTRERKLQNAPSDPLFSQQWWLQPVQGSDGLPLLKRLRGVPGFLNAWTQFTSGSAAARVAVLDSGVLKTHPELVGRLLPGYDMVSESAYANDGDGRDADPSDPGDWVDTSDKLRDPGSFNSCDITPSQWHGTAIAGMIGALSNNGQGVAGMNWGASVLPVRVAGKCGASVADIVDGMRWAAGLDACERSDSAGACLSLAPRNPSPVRVINLSFGGTGACDPYQAAIDELKALGVVVVAAAGNEHGTPTRPAKCPGVVGVAALNQDGFKSNYSNFGAALEASGIATVGGDDDDAAARWNALADTGVLSIGNTGSTVPASDDYFFHYGTSFAAPIVSGAISLMLSLNPSLTHAQILEGLRRSARPHVTSTISGVLACSDANPGRCLCTTSTCGVGILDVTQALAYARDPVAYVPPARTADVINAPELRTVAALGADRPPNPGAAPLSQAGASGGGAMSAWWLIGLAVAGWLLARPRNARLR